MVRRPAQRGSARERILQEATRLFASRGEGATSLQDVADAASVSKPAILHHFGSKEVLRDAVFAGIIDHWNAELPRLLLLGASAKDRFESLFGAVFRFFDSDPDRARLLMREALDRPAELKKLMRGVFRPWATSIAEQIRLGQERGMHFADVDPEAYVVNVLQLALAGAATRSVSQAALTGDAAERYQRELFRIARASLFKPRDSVNGASTVQGSIKKARR